MIPVITGFAAGGLHVFSGIDHLSALAPMAVADSSRAGRTGGLWGLGHGAGVVLVGGLGLWLRSFVDVEAWSAWAEFVVGFLLLGIGVWALRKANTLEIHVHPHEHDTTVHEHIHSHDRDTRSHRHTVLGVGILHGMAGSGHLFGVLPALALPTDEAVVYLISYLVAAVVSMASFAYLLGFLTRKGGSEWVTRLMLGSGVLAIGVGLFWIYNSWPF